MNMINCPRITSGCKLSMMDGCTIAHCFAKAARRNSLSSESGTALWSRVDVVLVVAQTPTPPPNPLLHCQSGNLSFPSHYTACQGWDPSPTTLLIAQQWCWFVRLLFFHGGGGECGHRRKVRGGSPPPKGDTHRVGGNDTSILLSLNYKRFQYICWPHLGKQ